MVDRGSWMSLEVLLRRIHGDPVVGSEVLLEVLKGFGSVVVRALEKSVGCGMFSETFTEAPLDLFEASQDVRCVEASLVQKTVNPV
ncbi:hypothetical protein NQZ68_020148 [Dissostichus eleginoides]|nr:hypothetical protein NQZ68_020148 [Dissostichus eleginoides]